MVGLVGKSPKFAMKCELLLNKVRAFYFRARICKRLRSPGIDSEESISPAYVAWLAGTTNRANRVVVYRPARLGIDSSAPEKVYKNGLSTQYYCEGKEGTGVPSPSL